MSYGTMEVIQTTTVGPGGAASIVFSNIPQTYSDLLIKISARLTFNASTASLGAFLNTAAADTSYRWLRGNGSVSASGNDASQNDFYLGEVNAATSTGSTFSSYDLYIPNYTGSTQKFLSADGVSENNATTAFQYLSAGLCTKTAAITSVTIRGFGGASGNLVQHSTATLYGITRVPAGAKASGGVITDTDTHWIHTFTSSGTFTPSQSMNVDYLVVAGGGGASLGGGGAGGLLTASSFAVTANANLTVTVGAGGAGNGAGVGANGGNSVFSTITATGGGGGSTLAQAGSGGSGGGAADFGRGGRVGTGTPGQGNNGGQGTTDGATWTSGGGGGGSSQIGGTTTTSAGGKGGDGSVSSISGISVTYAGGGGGGAQQSGALGGIAGSGGGGTGGINNNAGTNGLANSGGGAGGGQTSAASGGSGIVIIRYAK